jgi:RNA polymerase sigma-70 factor (ECF subfamily)
MNKDLDYINEFLSGNEIGFESLVKKYQHRVLNIVYSLVGRDKDSEDISQEVFLKVYHSLGSFKGQSSFSTWLYRIVVNTTYDFLRKRKHLAGSQQDIQDICDTSTGAREKILLGDRQALIRKALADIPFEFRSAVVLKDIEGLSYIEISKVAGCSIGTVESRIYRARQLLKTKLLKFKGDLI